MMAASFVVQRKNLETLAAGAKTDLRFGHCLLEPRLPRGSERCLIWTQSKVHATERLAIDLPVLDPESNSRERYRTELLAGAIA